MAALVFLAGATGAGLVAADLAGCVGLGLGGSRRVGEAVAVALPALDAQHPQPMLSGLGAVSINERLIASETIARRSFMIWGKLLRRIGRPESILRRFTLCFYILFLITMILTVVPLSAVIKRLLSPLTRDRIARQRAYFAAPSGEATETVDLAANV